MIKYGCATTHKRYMEQTENKRRRCTCGCGGGCTHKGMANEVCLTAGCELSIRRWVKYGFRVKK